MIRGETVSLVPLERRHLQMTRVWANDPELMRLMDRVNPVSEAEHENWFESLRQRTDCTYFAIETIDSRHIGNVWLWEIDRRHRRAEVRVVIGNASDHSRGAGTEAISLICEYAFEHLELHKVYAYVLGLNPRARRTFEKAGFVVEGVLRQDRRVDEGYTDVFLLGKLR